MEIPTTLFTDIIVYLPKKKPILLSITGLDKKQGQTLTRVDDGQCAHPVVFSTGCAKLNVVATVVVDTSLGQHGVVLNLRFPGEIKEKNSTHTYLKRQTSYLTSLNHMSVEYLKYLIQTITKGDEPFIFEVVLIIKVYK